MKPPIQNDNPDLETETRHTTECTNWRYRKPDGKWSRWYASEIAMRLGIARSGKAPNRKAKNVT